MHDQHTQYPKMVTEESNTRLLVKIATYVQTNNNR